jgi:cytochrome c1
VVAVGRDALDEAADRDGAADARFRAVTADLLALARAEAAAWPASRAKRFARDVERREQAVLAAAPGRDRERAWHELTSFLERAALGEQVASR